MSEPIEIASSFQHRDEKAVAKGVMVRYSIANLRKSSSEGRYDRAAHNWEWWLTYHHLGDNGEKPSSKHPTKDDIGNSNRKSEFHWKFGVVGKHLVRCAGRRPDEKGWSRYGDFPQEVAELRAIIARNAAKPLPEGMADPRVELPFIKKYAELLWAAGERGSRVTEMNRYATKLEVLLNRCDRGSIVPFRATYLAEESMEIAELRMFICYPAGRRDRLMIVDWTNLEEPRLSETFEADIPQAVMYDGEGAGSRADPATTKRLAEDPDKLWGKGVRAAIDKWKGKNRYWPGGVQFHLWVKRLPSGHFVDIRETFITGGKDFTDTLAEWLKKIGFYVAMFALVLTGVGSSAAGAIMVMSMVAGATGSVLSIHQRRSKGQDDALADAMDMLDIVANCLGVGGKAAQRILWKPGRTVEIASSGAKAVRYMFIGQKYANGFSGILLGASFAKRYNDIMNAKLSAADRADQLLALFKEAAQGLGLHVVNQKMATAAEKAHWEKLLEKDAVPTHIDKDPHVGGGDGRKGSPPPPADGVPNKVKDDESGFHVVPSDGVPRAPDGGGDTTGKAPTPGTEKTDKVPAGGSDKTDKVPAGGSDKTDKVATRGDTTVKTPKPDADADKTEPMKMTDKPGFKGDTKDGQKKVTVADKQQRNPTGGVPVANPPPAKPPKVGVLKRLALGLNSRRRNISYVKWAERKGYGDYGALGKKGRFDRQVEDAMKNADEIHFNLDGVDMAKFKGKPRIDENGSPESANWTNYELWLISTNKAYAKKVKWWNHDKMGRPDEVRKTGAPDTEAPDGWWPPGLNDPR